MSTKTDAGSWMNSYVFHTDRWWWGRTIDVIRKDATAKVEMQFDDDYPGVVFIKGLSVLPTERRKGVATDVMICCEKIARREKSTFLQLSVDKEQEWLVAWYKKLGFVVFAKDEHELTMIKTL